MWAVARVSWFSRAKYTYAITYKNNDRVTEKGFLQLYQNGWIQKEAVRSKPILHCLYRKRSQSVDNIEFAKILNCIVLYERAKIVIRRLEKSGCRVRRRCSNRINFVEKQRNRIIPSALWLEYCSIHTRLVGNWKHVPTVRTAPIYSGRNIPRTLRSRRSPIPN